MYLLIRNNFSLLLIWFIILDLGFSDPFKDLNIDFLLIEPVKPKPVIKIPSKKKSKVKTFKEVLEGFQKIDGLFTLYWNVDKNKAYISS